MPPIRPRRLALVGRLAVVLLLVSARSSDDGTDVRSSSGSASAGSGSSSGLAAEDLSGGTDDPLIQTGVASYRDYVLAEVAQLRVDTKAFTDAVRAGDLEAAKAAYAPSRVHWERIEPIAGLVEEIDGKVDARVDDFAGVDDPEFTGWHRIEQILFERGTTEGAAGFADQLDADLATLEQQIQTLEIPPRAVALGAGELVEEVSEGKITGEEDRYSGTDLWDFAANIDGSTAVVDALRPALQERDPALLTEVDQGIASVQEGLEPYRDGSGWLPYASLTQQDKDQLQARLAALAETLSRVPAALGLA